MSNADYHGLGGVYSSSQLKAVLEDPELFYKKYITKEIASVHVDAFDTGTYFHTKILEPHLLDEDCAVFDGVRRGAKWNEFKELHAGKAILTKTQADTADRLVDLVSKSPRAQEILEGSEREVSAFADLLVDTDNKEVYSADLEYRLTIDGWEWLGFDKKRPTGFMEKVSVKVRCDAMKKEIGEISDLKSSSGNVKNERSVKIKISSYEYDLSASFYLDIFFLAYEGKYDFKDFVWIFASKDKHNCKSWRASQDNIRVGRAKWRKAIMEIAKYQQLNWKFEDTVEELPPEQWQVTEWLMPKGEK